MNDALADVYRYRYFLSNLVRSGLKTRYRFSVLGLAWMIIFPAIHLAILSIVFSTINRWDLADYAVYLFSGLVPWNFFQKAVLDATNALPNNAHYITRVYTPRMVFPLNAVLQALVDFFAGFLVLLVLFMIFRGTLTWTMLFLPVSILIWLIFATGIGLIFSVINVFFRDCSHFAALLLILVFFSSPILFPAVDFIEAGGLRKYMITCNPMYYFVSLFQQPIHFGQLPSVATVTISGVLAVASLLVGVWLYEKLDDRFYYYL